MLDKIIDSCQFLLNNYPDAKNALDYLDSRVSKDIQNEFQFGYIPNKDNLAVLTSLINKDDLEKNGLIFSKNIEDAWCSRTVDICYFENYPLILPFKNIYGQNVGIIGRTLLSEQERKVKQIPKYKNSAESSNFKKGHLLFGLFENKQSILENNCAYIVEGQFDVIKAYEKGFRNVVALGNSNMTVYQFSVITRYTDNIFLLLDNDVAGEKGRAKILENFGKLANIQNFYLPSEYKDIDDYLTNNTDSSLSFIVK